MMKFGFMSFLLTILEVPISKICINKAVANSFLPCKDSADYLAELVPGLATHDSTSEIDKAHANNETANYEVNYCEAKVRIIYQKINK